MILKDYPEEVFNTTQQLLMQLQQLPDIPLSSSSAESPKGTKGSSASAAATEHEVFEAPWAPSGCNPLEDSQKDNTKKLSEAVVRMETAMSEVEELES